MKKTEKTGRWKRLGFRLLGNTRGRKFLSSQVRKHGGGNQIFSFPVDVRSISRLLLILPPDLLDTVYQVTNASAIMGLFSHAHRIILAETEALPLARVIGASEIVEYHAHEKVLFSSALTRLCNQFHDSLDCCCLLVRHEDLPLLYLTGMTSAALRIGYSDAGPYPFINLRVNPSPEKTYLPGQNCAIAEALGWDGKIRQTWPVAEETAAGISQLLRDVRLGDAEPLIGIDALSLSRQFGVTWAEECIAALLEAGRNRCYLYAYDPDLQTAERLSAFKPPLFSNLSIAQTAAILHRTECVISGKSLFYGLATLLGVKTVGIFTENDLARFSTPSHFITAISWSESRETVQQVVNSVREFLA